VDEDNDILGAGIFNKNPHVVGPKTWQL